MKSARVRIIYILLVLLMISNFSFAQFCLGDHRFSEIEYFSDDQIDSMENLVYGNAIDWQGVSMDLKMDIYYPGNVFDTLAARPFIMLIHGGAFQHGNKTTMRDECREFAKRGFVAATMSYRLGYDATVPTDVYEAAYRAQQDANAALRFIVEVAGDVKIDTAWIFIGGGSAGAITALNANYVSQQEWIAFYPGINTILGDLTNSGNYLNHSFTLKGIFNNWGATLSSTIDVEEMIPMVSFHGENDQVVPIDSSATGLSGSRFIHNFLQNNNVCSDLTVKPNAGHGIYNSAQGTKFRIGRATCFFKSLFCNDCSTFYTTDSIPANCSESTTISYLEIPLETGWNGISSYLEPTNHSLASITDQLGDCFICIQNDDGIYYPDGGVVTIEDWIVRSAYFVKVNQDTVLSFEGTIPDQFLVQLYPGWNLMPILSSTPLQLDSLFGNNISGVEIIKGAVGERIFWPDMSINEINFLYPGHAYSIKCTDTIRVLF